MLIVITTFLAYGLSTGCYFIQLLSICLQFNHLAKKIGSQLPKLGIFGSIEEKRRKTSVSEETDVN